MLLGNATLADETRREQLMEMETQAGRGDGDTGYYQRPGAKPGGIEEQGGAEGLFVVVVVVFAYFMSIPRKIKSREMLILLCCCRLEKDKCE